MNWLLNIDFLQLMAQAPQTALLDFGDRFTLDDVAALMVEGAPKVFAALPPKDKEKLLKGYHTRSREELPPKEWWPRVKEEFHIFLCTEDPKYENLRRKLNDSASATTTTFVGLISAAIGSNLGFEAGSIIGLVAACVYAAAKFGKEAYCANALNK
ncbi:hypothetical protein [Microbulbifer thermotolerans]|uniref:Uncharacterized protein n=1 Tax=Microbulbifer thermotolerans TaxID=252514 RepID=A0A143HMR0_MICTH|nr:hypothetical protein [Microbulbifer thermotolerans]AMX03015.1 hypothetical protein A3224_10940 [Microbulbifer thermotolerans]